LEKQIELFLLSLGIFGYILGVSAG